MFSAFNDDMLITAFSRSMMLILAAPEYYLSSDDQSKLIEKRIPETLLYLCDIECLLLGIETSKLRTIIDTYCNQPDGLLYATAAAKKVIDEIIASLLIPFRLDCDSKFKTAVRKTAGGFGLISGGIITVVGALAIPGILLGLIPFIGFASNDSRGNDSVASVYALATIPGILLSIPGIAIAAVGAWIIGRSWKATRDKPTMQYAQILKLILGCLLHGNPNQVLDEVPSLEESIVNQFREVLNKRKKLYDFANTILNAVQEQQQQQDLPSVSTSSSSEINDNNENILSDSPKGNLTCSLDELWEISDEELHKVLVLEDKDDDELSIYCKVKPKIQVKLRNWMHAIGRIHLDSVGLMESHLVIGFVGVHNAGKSTWINSLFDLNIMADSIQRTEKVELFPLNLSSDSSLASDWKKVFNLSTLKVSVVDYPGSSDEREVIAQMPERLSNVTTLFVCVFRFGHIARPEKDVIDSVKKSDRDFLVLINQCDIAKDLDTRIS